MSEESFPPSGYTLRKNDDQVLFYKLEKNDMSIIPEMTDCIRIDSELYVRPFFQRGACRITPLVLLWKRLSFVLQKYVKKLSCLFTVTKRLVLLCT